MSATAPGRRGRVEPADGRDRPTGLAEELRQAGGLVGRQDDPLAVLGPGRDSVGQPAGPQPGDTGLTPAEQVAGAESAAGDRLGRFRLPGQLEGAATEQPGLPVARPEICRGPILGQVARGDQVGPPLVGLPPQERAGLGDVARLVEDQQGARIEMVEPGRRTDDPGPDLGRVAGVQGTGDRHGRVPAPSGSAPAEPVGRPGLALPRPGGRTGPGPRRADPAAATPPAPGGLEVHRHHRVGPGTRSPAGEWRWSPDRRSAGRSGRSDGASRPRRRRSRSGPAGTRRAGRRRRCRRAGRTRRDRRPPTVGW